MTMGSKLSIPSSLTDRYSMAAELMMKDEVGYKTKVKDKHQLGILTRSIYLLSTL